MTRILINYVITVNFIVIITFLCFGELPYVDCSAKNNLSIKKTPWP